VEEGPSDRDELSSESSNDLVGETFANCYQIHSLLGAGGMGKIYKAYDLVLQRSVALKFVRAEDPQLETRLMREAHAQARIEHDNVCKIYDLGQSKGRYYIAMHFIEGKSLEDVQENLSIEDKVLLMKSVAEGIHAAHKIGLVHRDIKPSNIMVETTGDHGFKPVILDFGLVRDITRPDQSKSGARWAFQIAEIYAYRGEADKAFEWLERAYKQRDGGLSQMKGDPLLSSLERDPRWHAFLKKMKLPVD